MISSGWLKFFGSKSESAAGFGLIGDVLGVELLGMPLDASVPGDWMLPQPAPRTQTQDRLRARSVLKVPPLQGVEDLSRLDDVRRQLCPGSSPMTTVQGRMVHEVTKPF